MKLSQPLDGQSWQQMHLLQQNKPMLSLISLPLDFRLKYPLKLSGLLHKQKPKVINYYGMLCFPGKKVECRNNSKTEVQEMSWDPGLQVGVRRNLTEKKMN